MTGGRPLEGRDVRVARRQRRVRVLAALVAGLLGASIALLLGSL